MITTQRMPSIKPDRNDPWGKEHPFPYYGALVGQENAERQVKPGETAVNYSPGQGRLEIHKVTSGVLTQTHTFTSSTITTLYYEHECIDRPSQTRRKAFLGDYAIVRGQINPALGWNRHSATFIGPRGIKTLYQYLLRVEKNFVKAELLERHFPEWVNAPRTISEAVYGPLVPRKPWVTRDSQGKVVPYLG